MDILQTLFDFKDDEYADFQYKLTPGISRKDIIGVRLPIIRKEIAKKISLDEAEAFLSNLPHRFYDENILHSVLISRIKSVEQCLTALHNFLPYVDNWAVCDIIKPNVLKKDGDLFLTEIRQWINSDKTFTCRFGIKMLMDYFLDEFFREEYLQWVADITRDDYYVNMMIAWYFATALAKQYDKAIPYLTEKKLSQWVHNKTIRKSIESFRITEDQKSFLRTLQIKE